MTITLSLGWIFIILIAIGPIASWIYGKFDPPGNSILAGFDGLVHCVMIAAWWLLLALVYIIILHWRG